MLIGDIGQDFAGSSSSLQLQLLETSVRVSNPDLHVKMYHKGAYSVRAGLSVAGGCKPAGFKGLSNGDDGTSDLRLLEQHQKNECALH